MGTCVPLGRFALISYPITTTSSLESPELMSPLVRSFPFFFLVTTQILGFSLTFALGDDDDQDKYRVWFSITRAQNAIESWQRF